MGYKQSPALIAIVAALLLLAVATPLAYGQTVNAKGRLCCTSNGNCRPGSAGVPGVPVNLTCTNLPNGEVTVEQDITNLNGQYSIPINTTITLEGPLFTPPCVASVNFPLNSTNCPHLNVATGTLVGIPQPVPTNVFLPAGPLPNITVPIVFQGNATIDFNAP